MPRQFQFIAVSDPNGPISSESRKLTHSHVIRQKHAKARRLRTEIYQRTLARVQEEQNGILSARHFSNSLTGALDYSREPFSALMKPLSSQEYFLLHHYVQVVVPQSVTHCNLFNYPGDHRRQILQEWVGLAVTDKDLLDSAILLVACRSILHSKPADQELTRLALQYKQKGLEWLRQAVTGSSPSINAVTVAMSLAMAFDEEASGNVGIARQHLSGVFAMAELRGGPHGLGATGLLERMYNRFVELRELGDKEMRTLCGSSIRLALLE